MKPHYTKTKLPLYFLSLLVVTTLVSCATVQTAAGSDDGIYADDVEQPKRKIVQTNTEEYKDYNDNYFSRELRRIEDLNGTDIFTDIDNYSSDDYILEAEDEEPIESETQITTDREPWGYNSDSDVVINVNTFGNNQWGWGMNGWDPYWGWNINWGRNWGYNPYWHPYHWNNRFFVGVGGFYDPFFCPPFYGYNNRFWRYRGYRYGYRGYSRYRINDGFYVGGRRNRNAVAYGNRRGYSRSYSRVAARRSNTNAYRRSNRAARANRSSSRVTRRGNYSTRNNSSNRRARSYDNSRRSSSRGNYSSNRSSSRSRSYSSNRSSGRSYSSGRSSSKGSSRGSSRGGGRRR